MHLSGIRLDAGRIVLDGYPEGATVHGLVASAATTELCRLLIFRSDLDDIVGWVDAYQRPDIDTRAKRALGTAILVRFCCCFESTSGLRQKPLKAKKIFGPQDRRKFGRIKTIRNKIVAHDELLHKGVYPLIVVATDASAIEAVAFSLDVPFDGYSEFTDVMRMAKLAREWVINEFDTVAAAIVDEFNSLSRELRQQQRLNAVPDFRIHVNEEDRL